MKIDWSIKEKENNYEYWRHAAAVKMFMLDYAVKFLTLEDLGINAD